MLWLVSACLLLFKPVRSCAARSMRIPLLYDRVAQTGSLFLSQN